MSADSHIFVKLVWKTNPPKPSLRLIKSGSTNYLEYPLVVGENFNIRFLKERLCIGSELSGGSWVTCVRNHNLSNVKKSKSGKEIPVSPKNIQCLLCRNSDFFVCRARCDGSVCNPSSILAKEKCTPPNTSIYLTYVGGQYKAGVSLGLKGRWLEQGSDLSLEIGKAPGLEARRIEQKIGKDLDLKLQVRTDKKLQADLTNLAAAKNQLIETYKEIKPIFLEVLQTSEGHYNLEPEIFEFNQIYGDTGSMNTQFIDPVPGKEFGGRISGIKGSIIVVSQSMYYYALDTKKMRATTFTFLKEEATVENQLSLDEWF